MIVAAWVVMSLVHLATSSPVPPALAASGFPKDLQEWREVDALQEKRGGDNYLRFGRGDKRNDRNFLRFGRMDPSDEVEKRNRNYLRFGRAGFEPMFGRMESAGPLEFGLGYEPEEPEPMPIQEEKRALSDGRNNANYIRFGRSVDSPTSDAAKQPTCNDCDDSTHQTTPTQTAHQRAKRSSPLYGLSMSHSPVGWAKDFDGAGDMDMDNLSSEGDVLENMAKRYNKSFLRFGRDRNFLRFGKRDDPSDLGSLVVMSQYPRFVRAPQRNFLRFG